MTLLCLILETVYIYYWRAADELPTEVWRNREAHLSERLRSQGVIP